jgi:predicted transposase YbfD/YdcC
MRGLHHRGAGKKAIHMVSAFASEQGITLGQLKTEEKYNRLVVALPAKWLEGVQSWSGLESMIMVEAIREIGDKRTTECRFYINSLPANSKRLGEVIRAHWAVENSLHWYNCPVR